MFDTTLCDKICPWLATGRWFSLGTPVSSIYKTYCHNIIAEILLKVALNTITLTKCVLFAMTMYSSKHSLYKCHKLSRSARIFYNIISAAFNIISKFWKVGDSCWRQVIDWRTNGINWKTCKRFMLSWQFFYSFFLLFSSCCQFLMDCPFLIAPSVFSNVYLFFSKAIDISASCTKHLVKLGQYFRSGHPT